MNMYLLIHRHKQKKTLYLMGINLKAFQKKMGLCKLFWCSSSTNCLCENTLFSLKYIPTLISSKQLKLHFLAAVIGVWAVSPAYHSARGVVSD